MKIKMLNLLNSKKIKIFFGALGLLSVFSSAVGYAETQKTEPQTAQETQQSDPSTKLIAIVNGVNISQYEYDMAAQRLVGETANLLASQKQQVILQYLIDLKLMSEAARKAGYDKSLDYKRKVGFIAEQTLNNIYYSEEVLKKIDDAALQAYYQQKIKKIKPVNEMRARHILFKEDDEASVEKVLKLLEDGADFAKLAEEYSTGPSKTRGGDLGYFVDGEMDATFTQALIALKVGEYTKQFVKTTFGLHLIKLEDLRTKPLPTFDKVKNSLLEVMMREKSDELSAKLRQDATIELFIEQEIIDAQKEELKQEEAKESANKTSTGK